MSEALGEAVAQRLFLWALLSLAGSVFGLWRAQGVFWRAFWFMTGVWGLVDAAIAFGGWLGGEPGREELRRLLLLNAGLDLLYVGAGLWLLRRPGPTLMGFGLAIVVQGLFLLVFDLLHALGLGGLSP
ncbi:hypothetical protein [Thermus sp.]|uniref:DUF6992 family protein n=1 Tax=Thermus sp. TaxID=275 RepID=UPI00307EEC01